MKNFLMAAFLFVLYLFITCEFSFAKGNVAVLGVGGTIAGTAKSPTKVVGYKAASLTVDDIIKSISELTKDVNIVLCEQVAQIDSKDMTDDIWLRLAKRVNELLKRNNINGIVITHGTDTIEETAYFLSLVVKSKKPVVLVGAMRPSTAMSADGPKNLYDACIIAGSEKSEGRGVLVCLNDTIYSARFVTKLNTILPNAFGSLDFGVLGYVVENEPYFYNALDKKYTFKSEFDVRDLNALPKVDIVYSYAGTNSHVAVEAFCKSGVKGIIHAGTGNGSIHKETLEALNNAIKSGVIIVRSTRVPGGIVSKDENYEGSYKFIASDSLNPQKAKILLQLALTKHSAKDTKSIQELFYRY